MAWEAGSGSVIPSHRRHLWTSFKWNIKQEWRRQNNPSTRLWAGTKTTFPLSVVGKSRWCQSNVFVRTAQGVFMKDGKDFPGCWGRDIQSGKILLATWDWRLYSSLPVIMCLCLLISHRGGTLRNYLSGLSRVLVWQKTHTHQFHQHTCDDLCYLQPHLNSNPKCFSLTWRAT